ncbi:peptidoglycan DD-metalloendopeptidase family protein [Leucobacter viscericola]|uniref:Peptidoglycan DD-metalloendopeptidase family protein n=1 Tax=Leucobacter viscericola TaxID=2714935 RepID=A0A6G7XD87_9MICO|nr:peptidoglycan DD-metalloendopeptidase family protein [Leucobacter viscericola]QIK62338.1 peptidoglycan DD-metalloendopeptidase family protein [Leucobacter viscericola]
MASTGAEIAQGFVVVRVKMPGVKNDVTKSLGGVDLGDTGKKMGSKLGDGIKKSLKVAGVAAGALIATGVGTALFKGFSRLNSIDQATAKLRGLGNSTEAVDAIMKNALASVKGTAFGLDAAATTAAGAVAAGIAPGEELEGVLKSVANSAAAAGIGMDEMGSIYNKVASLGKAQNDSLQQVADKGIPIYQALATQLGVTTEEVFKMASKGQINFKQFEQAMTSAAGTVADEMGGTVKGSWANFMASVGRIGAGMLSGVWTSLAPLLKSTTDALGPLEEVAAKTGEKIGQKLAPAIDWLMKTLDKGVDFSMFTPLGIVFETLKPVLPVISELVKTLTGAFGAMLKEVLPPLIPVINRLALLFTYLAMSVLPPLMPVIEQLAGLFTDVLLAALPPLVTLLGRLFPIVGSLKNVFAEMAPTIEPFVTAIGTNLKGAFAWIGENIGVVQNMALAIGMMVATYYSIRGVMAVINGLKAAIAVAKAVQIGWTASTYGAAGASYAAATATKAQTIAAKAGMVTQKLWNGVVVIGKGIWALMNGSLIKSAALWTANTAKVTAHKIATIANNAGASMWLKIAAGTLATGWKTSAMWVKNTAGVVAHKTAVIAGAVASKSAAVAQRLFNAAMNANPIMMIVTAVAALVAGLIWFFTQTDIGREIWENFTRFLSEAWANIQKFFTDAINNIVSFVTDNWGLLLSLLIGPIGLAIQWIVENWDGIVKFFTDSYNTYLKPVFEWIGALFTGLWEGIQTAVQWIQDVWNKLGLAIQFAYQQYWKATMDGIAALFNWIWANIIKPVIDWIQNYIELLGLAFQYLYVTYIKPYLEAVGALFDWIWVNLIKPIVDGIKEKLDLLGLGFKILYEQFIKPAWDNISNAIRNGWNIIKGIIDNLVRIVTENPKKAFEAARDGIGKAWSAIQDLAKEPVRFVIETVINGLIEKVNGILPDGMKIPKVPLPKGFSEGGYTGNIGTTVVAGVVHGNEHVIRAQSRARIERTHPGLLDHMNTHGDIPGYRTGGLVTPLPQGSFSVSQQWGNQGHNGIDLAAPMGTKVFAAGDGVVQLAGVVPMGGNEVYIQHTSGLGTRYSHLSRFGTQVGAQVQAGNVIGYVGSTGMSTGPHLHYMVHNPGGGPGNYGANVNPAPYMGLYGADLGEVGGAASILDGLVDWAVGQLKGAFPGGGMFVDVATGLARNAAAAMAKAFNPFGAADGHTATLYDNGGWLPTGLSLVENRTRSPEPILTGSQWDAVKQGGGISGPVTVRIGDREFEGWMDERADGAVQRGYEDAAQYGRQVQYG